MDWEFPPRSLGVEAGPDENQEFDWKFLPRGRAGENQEFQENQENTMKNQEHMVAPQEI